MCKIRPKELKSCSGCNAWESSIAGRLATETKITPGIKERAAEGRMELPGSYMR